MIARRTLAAMAVGCGLTVANNYYVQPLLADVGRDFNATADRMGLVATLFQVGYAVGILLLVPLGDRLERRSFVVAMIVAVALALLGVAASPSYPWLAASALAVGFTTIAPQLLVPFAAGLAAPEERGRVVGTVMSGLLIGILGARTVSGMVGSALGWRAMYVIASGVMVVLALALRALLPRSKPEHTGESYLGLLASLGGLLRDEPVLRQSCLFGAMVFGSFGAFWTTLAYFLGGPPYGYSSSVVGLFGLLGAAGALAAPVAGRFADRGSPRRTIVLGLSLMLGSYAVLALAGRQFWGLVAGVLLLDLAAQATHISNQSRVYSVRPEARSRMNTAYMVSCFIGGSVGSYSGAIGWGAAGWEGVCLVGAAQLVVALIGFVATSRATEPSLGTAA